MVEKYFQAVGLRGKNVVVSRKPTTLRPIAEADLVSLQAEAEKSGSELSGLVWEVQDVDLSAVMAFGRAVYAAVQLRKACER